MRVSSLPLAKLVRLADTGTWGTEPRPGDSAPVLRSSNIRDSQLDLSDCAWRTIPPQHRALKRLADGDILVTTSSGSPELIGKCCLFRQPADGLSYYFSNFTLRLRANDEACDPRWLFYWLSSARGRAVLAAMSSTTSGLRNLSRGLYLNQRVPAVPLLGQRRIAAILDKADGVRRKRKEAIRLAEESLRSAFLEMFGDQVTNPKGWRNARLGELLAEDPKNGVYRPAKDYGSGTPIVRIDSFQGGDTVDLDSLRRLRLRADEEAAWALRPGDILVNRVNAPNLLGKSALVPPLQEPTVFESNMMRLRLDTSRADPAYVLVELQGPNVRSQVMKRTKDAVNQSSINQTDVCSLSIRLPPLEDQRKFARGKDCAEGSIRQLAVAADQARVLFAVLVQRAFQGTL